MSAVCCGACHADYACVQATDFGLSTFFKPGQRLSDVVGTAFYMAPEVLMVRY